MRCLTLMPKELGQLNSNVAEGGPRSLAPAMDTASHGGGRLRVGFMVEYAIIFACEC